MKRIIIIFFVILMLCGCKKEEKIICKIDIDNEEFNYNQKSIYELYYEGAYVTRIKKNDIYESESQEIIDYFKELKEYENKDLANNFGGIAYSLKNTKKKIRVYTSINFNEMDIIKFSMSGKIDSDYFTGNKLTLSGMINYYESKGAICK